MLLAVPALAQSGWLNEAVNGGTPTIFRITAAELRNMTAADFQRHIDKEGAQQFVRRLVKDVDPHAPEEPNYDIVIEHVAEGDNGWLKVAAEIAPYTDPTFSQGLRVAIADALVVNPVGVLRMIGTEAHFEDACGYPFVQQTSTYMQRHKREALEALKRVHQPALAQRKEQCRKQLMEVPPTTTAESSTQPAIGLRD
jgi:hypothetical protein